MLAPSEAAQSPADPAPRVSVVMSAHNEAPHIDAAVRSVLSQTFSDFELVIRDDGSTDGTGDLLDTWAKSDKRIRFYRDEQSLGLSGAGNFVIAQARASLVARMDADDIAHSNWLERLHAVISERPDVVLVGCLWEGIDSTGKAVRVADRWRAGRSSIFPPFGHGSSMFRRSAVMNIGGYRSECSYWEDFDLVLRLAREGTILFVPDTLYQYRFSSTSTRLVSDQRKVELAIDIAMACAAAYRKTSDYEAVLAEAIAPGAPVGRVTARTLVALSSNRLWNAQRPERLRKVIAATSWPLSREAAASIIVALGSEISPRGARAALAAIIRVRALGSRARPGGEPIVWDPLAGTDVGLARRAEGAFDLIVASCAPPGPARDANLDNARTTSIDRTALSRLTDWHRVAPFVELAVAEAAIPLPPGAVKPLAIKAARARFKATRNAVEEARLATAAKAAGLDMLFLKGSTLAALVYDDATSKSAWDIDVLISPPDLRCARAFLTSESYVLQAPLEVKRGVHLDRWLEGNRETLWLNEARGTAVELHLSLCESPGILRQVGMTSPRQNVTLAGVPVPTLAEAELFAFLTVHGTTHAWARLKWLADVAALIHVSSRSVEDLYCDAVKIGAGRCPAVALELCARLFGLTLPQSIKAQIDTDQATQRLVDHSWQAIERVGNPNRRLGAEKISDIVTAMRLQYWLAPGALYRVRTFWAQWKRPYAGSQLFIPSSLLPLAMFVWLPVRLLTRRFRPR